MISLFPFNNRKAQVQNWFAVITFLFSFGILSLIGYVFTTSVIQVFIDIGLYSGAIESAGNSFLGALLVFDKLTALIMVIMIVGVGVTSFRVAASNVFFVITWLLGAFYGLTSFFFNFMFAQIASNSAFSSAIAFFPLTVLICTNLHWVMLILIIVGSITLYAKREKGQFLT